MPSGDVGQVLIAVLAYNESASIRDTLAEVSAAAPGASVVVVDDGSLDQTAPAARAQGAQVIRHPINLGVAAAEATGLRYALQRGCRAVIRMDGDGQHDPGAITRFVAAMDAGADMVVGSRYLERGGFQSTFMRRFGNGLLCKILALLCRQRFTDPTSGFRGFSGRALTFFAHQFPHDYPEPESLLWASRQGFRVVEVPVAMRSRQSGVSSLNPARSAYYMIKVCFALGLELLRPRAA